MPMTISHAYILQNVYKNMDRPCVILHSPQCILGFPRGSVVKNLPTNERRHGFDPLSGRSPGEENGNSLHYSCLEKPMDRGAWWATVHGAIKSQTQVSD